MALIKYSGKYVRIYFNMKITFYYLEVPYLIANDMHKHGEPFLYFCRNYLGNIYFY